MPKHLLFWKCFYFKIFENAFTLKYFYNASNDDSQKLKKSTSYKRIRHPDMHEN